MSDGDFQGRCRSVLSEFAGCRNMQEPDRLLISLLASLSGVNPSREDLENLEYLESYCEKRKQEKVKEVSRKHESLFARIKKFLQEGCSND